MCFLVQQPGRKQQKHDRRAQLTCPLATCARSYASLPRYLAALALSLGALLMSSCGPGPGQTAGQHLARSQAAVLTYVAIGASETFGIGADDPYTENWPDQLASLLKRPVHVLNLGVPGITIHAALQAELPVALDLHPGLVTLWLAVNDLATSVALPDYSHDLDLVLARLQKAAPRAEIAVGNVPDLTSVPFFSAFPPLLLRQQMRAYNGAIASIVRRHHVLLVDLSGQGYDLQTFPQYVSRDGLHPSSIGYLQLAELFYEALQKKGFAAR
jgi:lysophospholipase L1-like esterase